MALKKLLAYFFLVFPAGLAAQKADSVLVRDSIPSQTLDEVIITANRYGSIRMNTPEAIVALGKKTILQNQVRTTPEALMLSPGVFVQKTNHGGGSPFLRGLTGNQTLQLVDGIRLSNSTVRYGPNQYFNTIDVFSIEKLEVLRGGGSVQYGSDAIGGTIQAFSHDLSVSEKPVWGSILNTRIATHGMEQSLNAGINYSNNNGAFRVGYTWRNFGDIRGGDTTGRQSPTGYSELDFNLKGKFHLSPSSSLTMAYQSVHQSDVPVYHKIALENYAINEMDPQKRQLGYLRLNKQFGEGILKSAQFTASYQQSDEGRESRKNNSSILRSETDKVQTIALSVDAVTSAPGIWSADSGFEFYNDIVSSKRSDNDLTTNAATPKRGLYPDGASMTSLAVFTLHTFDLPQWNITAGARLNTFIISVEDELLGRTKLTPSSLVGNMALLKKLNASSNLFVSLSTGFRAPNIDDLGTLGIVDFRYETPNFDLKPEHSFQYQTGYKFRNNNLKGEFYLYRNELYNLIVRNRIEGDSIEGYQVYRKENIERACIQGIETAWEFKANKSWSLNGSLTYTYGQNITHNEPVRRIPPLFGRLSAEYAHSGWWISLEWQAAAKQDRLAQGDKDDNRIPDGGTPGWSIINAGSGYSFRFVQLNLSLQNVLNKDYRFHGSGINGYGRSAFFSIILVPQYITK